MNPDPERLQSLPLFASLSAEECRQISEWTEVQEISSGQRLGIEGASGYTFFVIEDGTADVIQNGERVRELGPGDFFGEIAILGGGRRTASIVSTSPMRLVAMFGTEFRKMEALMPQVADHIRETMAARVDSQSTSAP